MNEETAKHPWTSVVVGYLNHLYFSKKYGCLKFTSNDSDLTGLGCGPGIRIFKKHPEVFLTCSQDYEPTRKICWFDTTWEKRGEQKTSNLAQTAVFLFYFLWP